MGDFKKNTERIMVYSPDNKACLGDLDTDALDVFFIWNYHKELGYNNIKHCWWHVPGKGLDNGLRNVNSDKEIREMVNCARANEGVIDVYFEHGVSVSEVLEGDNTVVYLDDDGGEGCNATTDADVSPPFNETHAVIVAPTPKVVPNTGDGVHLKRQLGTFTCSFYGKKGNTKRGCKKKRDAAAAAKTDEKKKKDEGHPAPEQQVEQPQDDGGQADVESNPVEIEISQPIASKEEASQKDHGLKRPPKLSPRRRSSLSATSPIVNPLQGTSSATATKFINLMKFIPTPGFKPPEKN